MATISRLIGYLTPMASVSGKRLPLDGESVEDEFLRLLWELPRMWRAAMDKRLKPLGLSEAKWRTILHLSRGKHVSQIELAGLLGIEAPTVARLIDRMAADGWLERRSVEHDRRVKTIHLLPKASSLIKQIDTVIFAMRREALRDISKTEIAACMRTLRKLRDRTDPEAVQELAAIPMRRRRAS